MTFTEPTFCAICGHPDKRDLDVRLAHWRDALPGMAYTHEPRCRDVAACRNRLELQGDIWPLVETTQERKAS